MDAQLQPDNSRRIARNTLMLYVRMLFLLVISFYTTRVVLRALGQDDLGIYNVVGGVVAVFSVISGALSAAISRFLTFELGRKDSDRLSLIFSSSVTIQIIIAAIIIILAEPAGLWFINHKMHIDPVRIPAARWVLQFSIATFAINLISVPYNAAIIAHERMKAFAGIGIGEGIGKLAVAFAIAKSSSDRLILYAILMCVVAVLVRFAYRLFCRKNFEECRFKFRWDAGLFKQMFAFAGWNFIGVSSGVLRDHGGNILINLFSGTAVNAARGLAMQVSGAVQNFSTNFMTALNPQITKSYARGDNDYTITLLLKGARMSFFLLLILGLPILANTGYLMGLWLGDVPEHAANFARLAILLSMSECLSNPLVTAMLATGDIKKYQIIVGGLQLLNLPISYICLKAGAAPESVLVVAIVLSQICLGARLVLLKDMIGLPVVRYIKEVWLKVLVIATLAALAPICLQSHLGNGAVQCIASCAICIVWTGLLILTLGMDKEERKILKTRRG